MEAKRVHSVRREDGEEHPGKGMHPYSRAFSRTPIKSIVKGEPNDWIGEVVSVGGWVRNARLAEKNAKCFVELNDGTCMHNLQCIVTDDVADPERVRPMGTCLVLRGEVKEPPAGAKQAIEFHATEIVFHGPCDPSKYPLALKRTSLEYLRDKLHLRMRTNTISAVMRIRNCISQATHEFFQSHGFLYLHTPLLTQSDCEGAGEMFQATTLLPSADEKAKEPVPDLDALRQAVETQGNHIRELKGQEDVSKDEVNAQVSRLKELKAELEQGETAARRVGGIPRKGDGTIDYSEDFFGGPAYLTVSGQLQGEMYACGMTAIYTFGPTFRAENSYTSRHLAEFWMVEPEMAFADNWDNMRCCEDYIRFCCKRLVEECEDDLAFLTRTYDGSCLDRVKATAESDFARCSYTEAMRMLEEAKPREKFAHDVQWGDDLQTEHERYLAEKAFGKPVLLYDYPKGVKAFYMKLNEGEETVRAMDLLAPKVGELAGGSQREEDSDKLARRCEDMALDPSAYEWYLDLRRFGTCVHSGFGVGLERLMLFATGMDNIRDVIPFPRAPKNCPG